MGITRRALIWYYAVIYMVNFIYGSIAITVVVFFSIEVVIVIMLLRAQVIAELERNPTNPMTRNPQDLRHDLLIAEA